MKKIQRNQLVKIKSKDKIAVVEDIYYSRQNRKIYKISYSDDNSCGQGEYYRNELTTNSK